MDKKREVIKKLKEYAVIQRDINFIRNKIKILDNKITRIKTSNLDDVKNTKDDYRIEKLIDEKTDLNVKLNHRYLEKDFIEDALNMLHKNDKKILIDYYCKKYSLVKISLNEMYSERQIRRKKENALKNLSEFLC